MPMNQDRLTELTEHIEDCYARLAVAKTPGERSTIAFVVEHLEAERAALEQDARRLAHRER
jgi:hypothetical protein